MQQQHQALSIGAVVMNRQQLTAIGHRHRHVLTQINRQARRFQGVAQGLQIPAPQGKRAWKPAAAISLQPDWLNASKNRQQLLLDAAGYRLGPCTSAPA